MRKIDAKYMVVDSVFVGQGSATDVAKGAELPDLDWKTSYLQALADGVLEQWLADHPGAELPDVI